MDAPMSEKKQAMIDPLREFVEDFASAKINALRFPPPDSPEDELDPVVEAYEVWAWQEDARAALAAATPTALATDPAVKALVAEAVAEELKRLGCQSPDDVR